MNTTAQLPQASESHAHRKAGARRPDVVGVRSDVVKFEDEHDGSDKSKGHAACRHAARDVCYGAQDEAGNSGGDVRAENVHPSP